VAAGGTVLSTGGKGFLQFTMPRRFGGFTQTIQTDGGSEFRVLLGEAEFAKSARLFCRQHRIARPYKKNEQSFIETPIKPERLYRKHGLP